MDFSRVGSIPPNLNGRINKYWMSEYFEVGPDDQNRTTELIKTIGPKIISLLYYIFMTIRSKVKHHYNGLDISISTLYMNI